MKSYESLYTRAAPTALAALILIGALLGAIGCKPDAAGKEGAEARTEVAALPVETMVVRAEDFVDTVDVSGAAEPVKEVQVAAEAAGRVLAAPFEEGEEIEKGAPLLRVDADLDSARIAVLRSQVSTAEREFERTELLAKEGVATTQQLDQAESALEAARLNLRQANVGKGKTTINAPMSGYVARKSAEVGEYVGPGAPVAHIVDYDTIVVRANVPESDIGHVEEGGTVDIEFPSLDRRVSGTVHRRAIVADKSSRTYPVEIHVPNASHEILPGMRARVIIPRGVWEQVVTAPRDAILQGFARQEAMVVPGEEPTGKAELRVVELGPSHGNLVVVKKGLEPGDRLIVKGHRGIVEGTLVRVVGESRADAAETDSPHQVDEQIDEKVDEQVDEQVARGASDDEAVAR